MSKPFLILILLVSRAAVPVAWAQPFSDSGFLPGLAPGGADSIAPGTEGRADGSTTDWRPKDNGRFDLDLRKLATVKSRAVKSSKMYPTFSDYQNDYFKSMGNWNTFTGFQSGAANTAGYQNTFTGYQAGYNNTQGSNNAFTGYRSGANNTSGSGNSMLGVGAGFNNTTGSWNTFVGYGAGYANTTGYGNVFIGYNSGKGSPDTNKLYIDNSPTATPLVFGDFETNILKVNGDLVVTGKITAAQVIRDADFAKLSTSLIETVKEQKKTIAALTARVEKLEGASGSRAR